MERLDMAFSGPICQLQVDAEALRFIATNFGEKLLGARGYEDSI